jgi:hypothetical protein
MILLGVKEVFQALQNKRKKSPFLIGLNPWLIWIYDESLVE